MKKTIVLLSSIAALTLISNGCKDSFLERQAVGAYSFDALANRSGVDGALVTAYRSLAGNGWYQSPMNWLWGDIRSDDAYKGSEASDQASEINPVERFEVLPSSPSTNSKWAAITDGVGQANVVLNLLKSTKDMTDAEKRLVEAQARFIRGFHTFEGQRVFNKYPWIPETASTTADFRGISNKDRAAVTVKIIEDLKFAYDNLPATWSQLGRVNKWAAGATLAKYYLYEKRFNDAKPLFDAVMAQGVTNRGERYGLLDNYEMVFMGANENSREMVLTIQYTVGDGTQGANANNDAELPMPHNNGPGGCCGFYQPSQNFVNVFRTDANGLPEFDTFNNTDVNNFEANPTQPFYQGELDPRLDWTVGRIGVPYYDHGVAQASWIRNLPNGGPYLPKKHVHRKSEVGSYYISGGWGQAKIGKNFPIIRYADVLLMAAEVEAELGNLATARNLVNQIRRRAANPDGWVKKYRNPDKPEDGFINEPFAKYVISEYPANSPMFANKANALKAIQYERRLELGMEGHRFFDLVRWGIADQVMNGYLTTEQRKRSHLVGARFAAPKDLYQPIPERVMNQARNTDGTSNLEQNPGYQ